MNNQYAQIQYHGEAGITRPCLEAIVRLIHFGDRIEKAAILTHHGKHCFLLTINDGDYVAVKSGFSSGYPGEGPRGLATALQLLERHGADIDEYQVSEKVIRGIDSSCLKQNDFEELKEMQPVRPSRWYDYIYDVYKDDPNHKSLNSKFPLVIPYGTIDPRIIDLALLFYNNPDHTLMTAFRRLEDIVRRRTGLDGINSTRLFSSAFQGEALMLAWEGLDPAEQKGRASMFTGIFMAYRNPRAHNESENDLKKAFREFLLLNELFILEAEAVPGQNGGEHFPEAS